MAIKGEKRRLGFFGEGRAVKFLKRNGYKILKRNYKCPFGEIDVIAQKDDVVCFVEVKTRSSDYFGAPNEAVNATRKSRYKNSARFYFNDTGVDFVVRFDIIEVTREGINHIENAFY